MKFVHRIAAFIAALVVALPAHAQSFGLAPAFQQIYFGSANTTPGLGLPLQGGQIYSCVAGSTCPGTPQPTYTDASGFTANSNPIILNSAGMASIWLNCSLQYKFVLQDQNGVTVTTVDNVSCSSGGGGGGGTNYWTLTGSTIANNNGGGSGTVLIGSQLNVGGSIAVTGNVSFADGNISPRYAILRAPNSMTTGSVTWRLPPADAAGCLTSDGSGNLSFQPCSGSGSTPGGSNSSVQFNNAGAFGGSNSLTWNNSAQLLTVTASSSSTQGIIVLTGYVQADNGFAAVNNATPSTPLAYNVIQAPQGGVAALSGTFSNYVQTGNSNGTPSLTTTDTFHPGAMYYDTGAGAEKLYNGSAWVTLASGGSTSPGGSNNQIQFNSSGSFGASPNLTFVSQQLTVVAASSSNSGLYVGTGYAQADAGFVASPSTATRYNVIQAPGGGVAALSGTFSNYVQSGNSNGVPALTSTDTFHAGALYWDTGLSAERVYNGTSWISLGTGGGATPGGSDTNIQYNSSGSFAGTGNFTWTNSTRTLVVNTVSNSQGFLVLGGYAQAEVGFLAQNNSAPSTALNYNAIQAPTGGMYAKSFRAINYSQMGTSNGVPTLTTGDAFQAGAHYWDTGASAMKLYNGSSWLTVSTGAGVTTLNTLSGNLTLSCVSSSFCTVGGGGTSVTITGAQNIATSSSPSFAGMALSGTMTSSVSGSSLALNLGSDFQVNGNGFISALSLTVNGGSGNGVNVTGNTASNSIQTIGGINVSSTGSASGAYAVDGTSVIDTSRNASFNSLSIGGASITSSGAILAASGQNIQTGNTYAVTGGYFGMDATGGVVIGSCTLYFKSGLLYSKSGC